MFEIIWNTLGLIGAIITLISVILFISSVVAWFLGVAPLFRRLGFGRWSRKLYIAADTTNYDSLKTDLTSSGVFRDKNIRLINKDNLSLVKNVDLLVVHYQSFNESEMELIIANKGHKAGLIVYFPEFNPPHNVVPANIMKLINNEPHSILVNMRGRLINDVLVTLLSTSYEKK